MIAIFSRQILLHEPIRMDWNGEQQEDFVHMRDLGWQAEVGQEEGLRLTINYFRENLGIA